MCKVWNFLENVDSVIQKSHRHYATNNKQKMMMFLIDV
jgi:hypothetical protein